MRRSRRRALVLGIALVATLVATWQASLLDEDQGEAAVSKAPTRARGASRPPARPPGPVPSADRLTVARAAWPDVAAEILPPQEVVPPAEPAAPPPPPAAPQPPPLPFRFVGGLDDGGRRAAFLLDGDRVRVVHAGDEIDGRYRVASITATRIEFIYVPLHARQMLDTSNPS